MKITGIYANTNTMFSDWTEEEKCTHEDWRLYQVQILQNIYPTYVAIEPCAGRSAVGEPPYNCIHHIAIRYTYPVDFSWRSTVSHG